MFTTPQQAVQMELNSTYVSISFILMHLLIILQMECAQINVTGGSGSKTPATVSLPGAYKVIVIILF
jgi:hypothetical protein